MVSEPPWLIRSLRLLSKIIPTLGHSTFRFNEQFLDKDLYNMMPIARGYSRASPFRLLMLGGHRFF